MDLVSIVLTLQPPAFPTADGRPLPAWWGRAAHQALLRVVKERNPDLSKEWHDTHPFTVSSLLGNPTRGVTCRLRFTSLVPKLTGLLCAELQPGGLLAPGARLELDHRRFTILSSGWQSPQDIWAGGCTYHELAARSMAVRNNPNIDVCFELASPTSFALANHASPKPWRKRHLPLPMPELFFGNLLDRWNESELFVFPKETGRFINECLVVSRFELRSSMLEIKNGGMRKGATGRVTFTSLEHDRYFLGVLHTLAAFSRYSGVGIATSEGMGQCRQISLEEVKGIKAG